MVEFLKPFVELLERSEQRKHATTYFRGRLKNLPRRTLEPIAVEQGDKRRPLQHFVGAGRWDDKPIRDLTCRQIAAEFGSPNGVLIVDGSGIQKAGLRSVGAQRQYCGRLGKKEVCQIGEFLAYASKGSVALVDCELYLPRDWVDDVALRDECHVPKQVQFKTGWELAAEMVLRRGRVLPHRWVVGDEQYGTPRGFRDLMDREGEPYVLEVRSDTLVHLARGGGLQRACDWADGLGRSAWQRFTTRNGEKGPVVVRAVKARVYTPREPGQDERAEILVVVRNDAENKTWYYLASDTRARLKELVRVGACRYEIEHAFTMAKGDVGLDEYEVRSWVGWHHHMTLSMLALWFLVREQRALKKTLLQSPSLKCAESSRSYSRKLTVPMKSPTLSLSNSAATKRHARADGRHKANARLLAGGSSLLMHPDCPPA